MSSTFIIYVPPFYKSNLCYVKGESFKTVNSDRGWIVVWNTCPLSVTVKKTTEIWNPESVIRFLTDTEYGFRTQNKLL
jgi:hypothetical protein